MKSAHFHNHLGSKLGVVPTRDGGDGYGGGGKARGNDGGGGGDGGSGGSVRSDCRCEDGRRGDGRIGWRRCL